MFLEFIYLVLSVIFIHQILMKIFSLTTYHAYFFKTLPLLLGYSVLSGWAVYAFLAPGFMLWFFSIEAIFLIAGLIAMRKQISGIDNNNQTGVDLVMSARLTCAYYVLSAIVFLVTAFVAYVYFYNA